MSQGRGLLVYLVQAEFAFVAVVFEEAGVAAPVYGGVELGSGFFFAERFVQDVEEEILLERLSSI